MTRRMKATPGHSPSGHGAEHDENEWCRQGIPCEPVPAQSGVTVPDTGTWLVTDGAVHTAGTSGGGTVVHTRYEPGRTVYTFTVRAFFEEGKTYRREYTTSGKRQTFMAERVVSEDGVRFAFGRCETEGYGVDWVVRRQHHWDGAGWEEVR